LHIAHLIIMCSVIIATIENQTIIQELVAGVLGVGLAFVAHLYHRQGKHQLRTVYTVATLAILSWGVGAEQSEFLRSIGWSALGLGCLVVIRRTTDNISRGVALVVVMVGAITAWTLEYASDGSTGIPLPVFNLRVAALVLSAIVSIGASRFISDTSRELTIASNILRGIGYLSLVLCVYREVFDAVQTVIGVDTELVAVRTATSSVVHGVAVMCSMFAALIILVGYRRLRDDVAAYAGTVAYILALLWWIANVSNVADPTSLQPFTSMRALTGLVMIIMLALSMRIPEPLMKLHPRLSIKTAIGILLVVFSLTYITIEVVWSEVIVAYELRHQGPWMPKEIAAAWDRFHLRMSATWIGYSILLMAFGFIRRNAPIRTGALVLLLLTISKVFVYDLSFLEQPYRMVSFIALGAILLVAGFLYQRYRQRIVGVGE
jgi:hypothetical protein